MNKSYCVYMFIASSLLFVLRLVDSRKGVDIYSFLELSFYAFISIAMILGYIHLNKKPILINQIHFIRIKKQKKPQSHGNDFEV